MYQLLIWSLSAMKVMEVKLTLNNKIAPVIIPGTMQNNILSGAETGEKGFVYGENNSISEQVPDRKMADKELLQVRKNRLQIQ